MSTSARVAIGPLAEYWAAPPWDAVTLSDTARDLLRLKSGRLSLTDLAAAKAVAGELRLEVVLAEMVRTGEPLVLTHGQRGPDGKVRTYTTVAELEVGRDGRPPRLTGCFIDVTDAIFAGADPGAADAVGIACCGRTTVVVVSGELDASRSAELAAVLGEAAELGQGNVYVDARYLRFCDVQTARELVRCAQSLRDRRRQLVVVHPPELLRRVLAAGELAIDGAAETVALWRIPGVSAEAGPAEGQPAEGQPADQPRPRYSSLEELALTYAELGDGLAGAPLKRALQRILELAVERIDAAQSASISAMVGPELRTLAATDGTARSAEELQRAAGSGPTLDVLTDGSDPVCVDLTSDERWRLFGERATAELGLTGLLCTRLAVEADEPVAALTVYGSNGHSFGDEDVLTATLLAAHAAGRLSTGRQRDRADHLTRALDSSREIGVAVGILMQQRKLSRSAAFDLLVIASQHTNRKLRDIATELADTGQLPLR